MYRIVVLDYSRFFTNSLPARRVYLVCVKFSFRTTHYHHSVFDAMDIPVWLIIELAQQEIVLGCFRSSIIEAFCLLIEDLRFIKLTNETSVLLIYAGQFKLYLHAVLLGERDKNFTLRTKQKAPAMICFLGLTKVANTVANNSPRCDH